MTIAAALAALNMHLVDDPERAVGELRRLAAQVCTKKQQAALEHFLAGRSLREGARAMGVSHVAYYQHIHGHPTQGGGAINKLRAAVEAGAMKGPVLMPDPQPDPMRDVVASWFSTLPPSREHMFGPLAVLLVAYAVADARGRVAVADLRLYMPGRWVSAAIPQLKASGYVLSDGTHLTIRKTPLTEREKERT